MSHQCEVCGNEYDNAMEIRFENGESHWFDCFECATHLLAPSCKHCGVKIVGHGVQVDEMIYCCAHCTREHGIQMTG